MQKDHFVPLSILVGCTIIAAGLYFGLKSQSPSPLSGAQSAGPTSTAVLSPPPQTAAPPASGAPVVTVPMRGVSADVQAAAEKAASEAVLAEKKTVFVPKCWLPAIQKDPKVTVGKYQLNMMFNAEGKEIGRGLNEDRATANMGLANCIRDEPLGLQIAPPGVPISVSVPLEFP